MRDPPGEAIVVDEKDVGIDVEQPIRNRTIISIETEVHKRQFISSKDVSREPTKELVVAQIQLIQEPQFVNIAVDNASEVVGISMEDGNVGQVTNEAIEVQERTTKSSATEVDGG